MTVFIFAIEEWHDLNLLGNQKINIITVGELYTISTREIPTFSTAFIHKDHSDDSSCLDRVRLMKPTLHFDEDIMAKQLIRKSTKFGPLH